MNHGKDIMATVHKSCSISTNGKLKPLSRSSFFELVYETARLVPKGRVTTYSLIAEFLGNPRGSRAVGWAMAMCPYSDVPCHRVVRSDGIVAGHPDEVKKRITMLKRERINVKHQRVVDLPKYLFSDFD
ncbi:MAG: MGMT family protein [Nitrososphaerales archaeon]